jgi:hypothetical protein
MRRLTPLLLFLSAAVLCLAGPDRPRTKRFEGAWFTVRYPAAFTVRPGMPGRSSDKNQVDSAYFVSPDKKVEFYVYSPQWNGEPTDYALEPKWETLVAKREQTVKKGSGGFNETIRVQWVTVKAKNGAYTRSWVDTENTTLNTRHVFGIKYTDLKSYQKYRAAFEAFKKSLEQFGD